MKLARPKYLALVIVCVSLGVAWLMRRENQPQPDRPDTPVTAGQPMAASALPVKREAAAFEPVADVPAATAVVESQKISSAPSLATDQPPEPPATADVAGKKGGPPAEVLEKLDAPLARGLEKSHGATPLDPRAGRALFIPMNDDGTLMVDIQAPASEGLLSAIAAAGGTVARSPDPARIVSAMVPFAALEALAGRADVRSIVIAKRTRTSGVSPAGAASHN